MKREFLTRTTDDDDDAIIDALHGRENEIAAYDANVEGYYQQIAALDAVLPKEWPSSLLPLKGKSGEQMYVIGGSDSDLALAAKLNHRDRLRMLLFTEQIERAKAESAYDHCLQCIPKDQARLKDALARHADKIATQKAKNLK